MNRLALGTILAIVLSCASFDDATAQYCPQIFEGQMGNTYYYWCQDCNDGCTAYCMVAASQYANQVGGCCSNCNCGNNCNPVTKDDNKGTATTSTGHHVKPADDPDDLHWVSSGVNSWLYHPTNNPNGFRCDHPADVTTNCNQAQIMVNFTQNYHVKDGKGGDRYFACLELVQTFSHPSGKTFKVTYRIGHELLQQPTSFAEATIKTKYNVYNHIQSNDTNDGQREFDVLSKSSMMFN